MPALCCCRLSHFGADTCYSQSEPRGGRPGQVRMTFYCKFSLKKTQVPQTGIIVLNITITANVN